LVAPGASAARGVVVLSDADRRALAQGRLLLVHVSSEAPLGVTAVLKSP
jgi:hypothetical protein